jgi:hypothetical protein
MRYFCRFVPGGFKVLPFVLIVETENFVALHASTRAPIIFCLLMNSVRIAPAQIQYEILLYTLRHASHQQSDQRWYQYGRVHC